MNIVKLIGVMEVYDKLIPSIKGASYGLEATPTVVVYLVAVEFHEDGIIESLFWIFEYIHHALAFQQVAAFYIHSMEDGRNNVYMRCGMRTHGIFRNLTRPSHDKWNSRRLFIHGGAF